MNSTWSFARLFTQSALHVELVRTASYLALAGVIALLLCLLLLATVNTCLICRNPSGKRPSPYIESMTDVPRAAGQCSPYHMTHLHAQRDGSAKPARKSCGSGGYAKPFHPGRGVSLSKHYVTVDIEPNNGHGSAPMTDAGHQCSTWYDTDIVVLRSPQNSCLRDNGRYSCNVTDPLNSLIL
ncbi:uncharacterized protein [Haliotis cracherodii]|uniref:uncharacterized protein n=1 Tax=Haliotis cracherodii TaxID=6455 RepID=UPI0039EA1936